MNLGSEFIEHLVFTLLEAKEIKKVSKSMICSADI